MPYRPKPNDKLTINTVEYTFTEHPAAPGMAYGQTGRRATVYQVQAQDGSLHALKVFTRAWRDPRNAASAQRLRAFASLPGMQVCERTVFTPETHAELLSAYPDLEYAVLMAWVSGETWQEVMLNGRPLSADQSREIGLAFLGILERMERESLAHCDLSGPNVLMQFSSPIRVALVDVEDLYGPDLARPDKVGGGSSGYAHKTAPRGLWQANADRFAGAILLAEMLGWCDERVRRIGYGEQYFDPAEVQQSNERYQVLYSVLREKWDSGVADAFARAWFSETLEECPSFKEWDRLLNPVPVMVEQPTPEQAAQAKVDEAEDLLGKDDLEQAVLVLDEAYILAPEIAAATYARALLTRGTTKERENDREGALADYQKALEVAPQGGLRDEMELIVAEMTPKPEPAAAAPGELPAEEALVVEPEPVIVQPVEEVEQSAEEPVVAEPEEEPEPVAIVQTDEVADEDSEQDIAEAPEEISVEEPVITPELRTETAASLENPPVEAQAPEAPISKPAAQPIRQTYPARKKRKLPIWAIALIALAVIGGCAVVLGATGAIGLLFTPSAYEPAPSYSEPVGMAATAAPTVTKVPTKTPSLLASATSGSSQSNTTVNTATAVNTQVSLSPVTAPTDTSITCTIAATSGAKIRPGPGTNYIDVITTLPKDTLLIVVGRNNDGDWLVVWLPNFKQNGWIYAPLVTFDFDINDLPVIVAPPAPTVEPTDSPDSDEPYPPPGGSTPYP